mgnify:CR=1 FL=1
MLVLKVHTFEEGDMNVHTISMPLASVKEIWCLVFVRYEGAAELHVVGRFC